MQIKLLVSAAAIALVAGLASASAAEQFTTLDGVTAVAMTSGELDAVVGSNKHFSVSPLGTDKLDGVLFLASFAGTGLSPKGPPFSVGSGKGLFRASEVNDVITVLCPGTGCL